MSVPFHTSLLGYLSSFLSPQRIELFEEKVSQRTRYVTLVLEDIFQSHNVSAVIRSCECFGVQDVHVIENNYEYQLSQNVAMGSSKWLNLHRYAGEDFNSGICMNSLIEKGYRIVATTPHSGGYNIQDLPLDKPVALWFGTERKGLSSYTLEHADDFVTIPMVGFTESLNISVSAAICLFSLTSRLKKESWPWPLNEYEKVEVMLEWTRRSLKRAELLERQFINQYDAKD